MRRAIHFVRRHKFLAAAMTLLMVGVGCVGAVRETARQLKDEASAPISVPVRAYRQAVDAASGTEAVRSRQMEEGGLLQE